MNWAKIKNRCPNAIKVLEDYYKGYSFDYDDYKEGRQLSGDDSLCHPVDIDPRDFLDFFDKHEIYGCVVPYTFVNNELRFQTHIDNYETDGYWRTRMEAEDILFPRLFEILEQKLTK